MLNPLQTNRPKSVLTSKSLISVAFLVFPFSLLWPTLLTCSVTATSLSFLKVFGLPALFELSCQLISRVQPGPMTCMSCLIRLRYVEPLSSASLHLVAFSMQCTLSIPAPQGGVPYWEPLKRNFPVVESCFNVGLILEPREGWIVTS